MRMRKLPLVTSKLVTQWWQCQTGASLAERPIAGAVLPSGLHLRIAEPLAVWLDDGDIDLVRITVR